MVKIRSGGMYPGRQGQNGDCAAWSIAFCRSSPCASRKWLDKRSIQSAQLPASQLQRQAGGFVSPAADVQLLRPAASSAPGCG
jgi:hypothetical protein